MILKNVNDYKTFVNKYILQSLVNIYKRADLLSKVKKMLKSK